MKTSDIILTSAPAEYASSADLNRTEFMAPREIKQLLMERRLSGKYLLSKPTDDRWNQTI